jgi:hypothetical protein
VRKQPVEERFWSKVKKTNGCWIWTGYRKPGYRQGYGEVRMDGRTQRAHRVAWKLINGPIPLGLFVLHHCDNPSCVNPDHLWLGTQKENMRDSRIKGRWLHKLTEAQVRTIRASHESHRTIGHQFGIAHRTVGHIKEGKKWAWLD